MAFRSLAPVPAAAMVATVALLIPVHGAAQGGSGSGDDWTTPRTPWGDPDLQGVWTTDSDRPVPFERPTELGERAELTPEECALRAERALARDVETLPVEPTIWHEYADVPSPQTSLVVDPADGRIPPLTLGAKARQIDPATRLGFVGGSFDDVRYAGAQDLNLSDRCITRGMPQTWQPSAYGNGFQIVQTPGNVALLYERLHEHRIIPLDGRPSLHPSIGQIFGDSRGYWDGDTLVVEVTNFSDQTNYRGAGATRRLIERYTRVDDDAVRVEITIDDPTTWTKPWTFAVTGKHDPDYWQIFEFACHEGNYSMTHMLEGVRNLEKAGAEGSK